MMLIITHALALHGPAPLRGPHSRIRKVICTSADGFCRASDVLAAGERVPASAIVNVLGRWSTSDDWDSIGVAKELDEVLAGKRSDYPSGASVEASPRRRDFCKRQGVVQRYILNATVGLLPFRNARIAASVGCTVREMTAEPIDPRAVDVVFDALSESQSGIIDKAECDARRATFETADGSFDAEAFQSSLDAARRKIVLSYALYPGVPNLIFLFLAYRLNAFDAAADSAEDVFGVVKENWETMGPASLLLPALPVGLIGYGAANPPKSNKAAGEAAAADRLFMAERVATRQATETEVVTSSRRVTPSE